MALVFKDRVKVRAYTSGTGNITLGATVHGFQGFDTVGDGNETYYGIEDAAGNWEVGRGTYTALGSILSRDTVIDSSNAGAKVNFPAGGKSVFTTLPSSVAANIIASTTYAFRDIVVAGQSTVIADSTADTLTLAAGTGISITTNSGTDTITITGTDTGSIEFTGSTISTNDSSNITVDQAVTLESDVTVGGDILPKTDEGGALGSPTLKWKELFVSTGSIYIGDVKLSNVAGKLVATKVINPGEENEEEDPEDSNAGSDLGSGGGGSGSGSINKIYSVGSLYTIVAVNTVDNIVYIAGDQTSTLNNCEYINVSVAPPQIAFVPLDISYNNITDQTAITFDSDLEVQSFFATQTTQVLAVNLMNNPTGLFVSSGFELDGTFAVNANDRINSFNAPYSFIVNDDGTVTFPDGTKQSTAYSNTPIRPFLLHEYADPDPFTTPKQITIDGIDYAGGEIVQDNAFGAFSSRVTVYADSMFAMIAVNTDVNAVYYNGETGSDGAGNAKVVTSGLENYRDGYYSWYNKISGDDPCITQIVIAKNPATPGGVSYYNRTTNTNNDDFTVEGLAGATTVIVFNVYWNENNGPAYESSIETATMAIIDAAIYDGGPTELTDLTAIRAAFYARSADMKSAIEGWEGDLLFTNFDFFGETFQAVRPTGGNGSRAVLEIQVRPEGDGTYYYDNRDVILPGTGYQINDVLTVLGSEFGGTSPANDVTITVNSINTDGGIVDYTATGDAPNQVWPQSYILDGNNDIYDIGNFIGTNHTRVTALVTLTYTPEGGGEEGNDVFQTLNVISADKPIRIGQWAWFADNNRGAFINWGFTYGDNNSAAYLDEYTGYTSTAELNYDYQVDVDNAHLNINGAGDWFIGSSNFNTNIRGIDEIDSEPRDIEVRANGETWLFGRDGNLYLPPSGDIKDSNGDSVLGAVNGNLIGNGSDAGTGFTRTVYTDFFGGQGGEADGDGNGDWFISSDVTGVEVGDTITFQQGEVRTISNVTVASGYTVIDWSGDAVTGSDTLPRYPVTITSSDYVEATKNTARIKPDSTAANDYGQYVDIYAGGISQVIDSKHIHMAGHNSDVELFLGTDNNYVATKEAGTAPAGVRLHSENDVSVESSNLRINRKGSSWAAVYGDGENYNQEAHSADISFGPIAVDEHGDYYVGGEHIWLPADAIISKYGRDGNLIWSKYNSGLDVGGWDIKAIAYHNGEVATVTATDNGRITNYIKLTVQDSTTGEIKSTRDIYDADGNVSARSMCYHSTLGWIVAGRTWGETATTGTITGGSGCGVGVIEVPLIGIQFDETYPKPDTDWYVAGTNISGRQYLSIGTGRYSNVAITSVTGGGSSATARVTINYNTGSYATIAVQTQGSGYALNDELKIPGSLLGGVDAMTSVTASPISVSPGDNITAYFDKATYPDLYDQLKWASYTVSYNAGTHNVVNIVSSGDNWAVTIDSSDINLTVATFYTANGNDLTFLAQVAGDALVGPNSALTGVASRKTLRLEMSDMAYGSTDFTGGSFTFSRQLNSQPWVWTSSWTRYLNQAGDADIFTNGTAYTVVEDVWNGGVYVGGFIESAANNSSFIWKLASNGTTNWVKALGVDGLGVRSIAVSTVDGSVYATSQTPGPSSINKLSTSGTLITRKYADGMWGVNAHVKLEIGLDGLEYVYVGGGGGAIWAGPTYTFMVNKFTSALDPIWGREMYYQGGEGLYTNYDDTYNNFVLGKGQVSLAGYTNMFGQNRTNAAIFTIDTTDEFVPVSDNNWVIGTNTQMAWALDTSTTLVDLLVAGVEAETSSVSTDTEVTALALIEWTFQQRVINLNGTANGIVGVETVDFASGGALDHNPSDIPPSVGFDSVSGWNYTLQLSDRGRFIINQTVPNNSYAENLYITVPRNDNVSFPVGTVITLINSSSAEAGGYSIHVTPESFGDPNSPQIWATGGNQNPSSWSFQGIQTATLMKISTNGWLLTANDITNTD